MMKKLYLWICTAVTTTVVAQDIQNSNWIFATENRLTFSPASTLVQASSFGNGLGFNSIEGCASVSDRLGNLIMFSDGITIWTRQAGTFVPAPFTLMGNPSSAQNVIFIPVPNWQNRYFIVTTSGRTTTSNIPGQQGIYFSQIDISGVPQIVNSQLNVPLANMNGNLIDATFGNQSEAITSVIHSNGQNYWLIAHAQRILPGNVVEGNVLSFKVTETGIGGTLNRAEREYPITDLTTSTNRHALCLKISPNTQRIALSFASGGIFTGEIDNATGEINLQEVDGTPIGCYGIEFSPDSNVLYYLGRISSLPANGPGTFIRKVALPLNTSPIISEPLPQSWGMQRGLDGKIYIAYTDNRLNVISTPNDAVSLTIVDDTINLADFSERGLPQWIWKLRCETTLSDNNDIPPGFISVNEQRSETIFLTNVIQGRAIVPIPLAPTQAIYHAGQYIEMLPEDLGSADSGFEAEFGSQFVAEIAPCDTPFIYKNGQTSSPPSDGTKDFIALNKINIFPNPSKTSVTISCNEALKSIRILSMDGKTIFTRNANEKEFQIDVSTFVNGMYLINVETQDGQFLQSKFIKN